jgi:hypothetical protein
VALPVTREDVISAERRWGGEDRLAWESQWLAIETIISDIWATPASDADRLRRLWVFLTYSVGNFKRQGNTVIFPLPAPWTLRPLSKQCEPKATLTIHVGNITITLKSDSTTEHLGGLTRGLASVPTGSALLAALWPTYHAIMDIRDFQVAVGLLACRGADIVAHDETASLYPPDWDEYRWFRALMRRETSRLELTSPLLLERALFVAYDYGPEQATGMTWPQWGAALLDRWQSKTD